MVALTDSDLNAAVDALIRLLQRDLGTTDIERGAYYKDFDEASLFPCVVVVPEQTRITRRGPGWERQTSTVRVLFRFRGTTRTPAVKLENLADRVRAMLDENPRLDGTTAVERAKVLGWRPLYGKGVDFVEDVANVDVELVLFRTGV